MQERSSDSTASCRMTDELGIACPNCGANDEDLKGLGPLYVIPDTAYQLSRALFAKAVDDYRCHVCQRPMGLRPTIIVVIGKKSEYLYCFGTRALDASDELRQIFANTLRSEEGQVEAFATPDDLRVAYTERITPRLERVL